MQLTPELKTKMMQLYETLCVRHGVMVVGGAMAMKTTIIHMLAQVCFLFIMFDCLIHLLLL